MVALATPLPLASSACTVMGWKNCSEDEMHRHTTWPSPDMVLRLATVCAVAMLAPDRAPSIAAIAIILDRDKTASWFRGNTRGNGIDAERNLLYHRCRSEERRVGKECRSRWSPYH